MRIRSTLAYLALLLFLVFCGLFNEYVLNGPQVNPLQVEAMRKFFSVSLFEFESLTEPETVLLMGKQGTNVDTIMLARVDPSTKKVNLFSIPRDLYVEGKKINSFFAEKGLEAQVAIVENISGVNVDKYVLVDLESFRTIVDLLGGIDVTLTKDLVDPSYKVCDGEVCSTLNYPVGTYHLGGTEALRIARSRHSTSDYDRAERQQIIISAIKSRLSELSFKDMGTMFEITGTALNSVSTNFTFSEIAERMFSYRTFGIYSQGVLSTANVLSAVPVPVAYVTSHFAKTCIDDTKEDTCQVQYFIDTLQAKNGDLEIVKAYVQSMLYQ
ncbi:MAG: LCP family protein [Candidatus Gracilibacteria bacterium]